MRYPAALLGHVSLHECSMAQNEGSHGKLVKNTTHTQALCEQLTYKGITHSQHAAAGRPEAEKLWYLQRERAQGMDEL